MIKVQEGLIGHSHSKCHTAAFDTHMFTLPVHHRLGIACMHASLHHSIVSLLCLPHVASVISGRFRCCLRLSPSTPPKVCGRLAANLRHCCLFRCTMKTFLLMRQGSLVGTLRAPTINPSEVTQIPHRNAKIAHLARRPLPALMMQSTSSLGGPLVRTRCHNFKPATSHLS